MPHLSQNPSLFSMDDRRALWAGRIASGLAVAFLTFDSVIKLIPLDVVLETYRAMGWPADIGFAQGMGSLLLACIMLYVWPRTAFLGAILLTAYLGGAIAAHVRIGSPLVSHTLFGVYLGVLVWGGLFLKDQRLRRLFPITRKD
ncbi:DoxX family protein [Pararhizobium sp. PWRC1-1]|uniref:DoxX family protein n=1 Tax=Pararhizobium sp. PWRC1-1 TaxID=2804566 RepID=UPI003CF8F470